MKQKISHTVSTIQAPAQSPYCFRLIQSPLKHLFQTSDRRGVVFFRRNVCIRPTGAASTTDAARSCTESVERPPAWNEFNNAGRSALITFPLPAQVVERVTILNRLNLYANEGRKTCFYR